MADGYSGWVVLGAAGLGVYAGFKLIPWMRRIEETERLVDLAERILDLAEEPAHQTEALEILRRIQKHRDGVKDHNGEISDEDHESMLKKVTGSLTYVTKKLNPFSSNGKSKKKKVVEDLESDAA